MMSFEELWVESEKRYSQNPSSCSQILDEVLMKVKLYQAVDQKTGIPPAELEMVKLRTMGEILLSLTKLSMQDNINVYEALSTALQSRT